MMILNLKTFNDSHIKSKKYVFENNSSLIFNFEYQGKIYYYKKKSEHTHIHNEIMCNILANKLGLINSKMIEASYQDTRSFEGLLSEDYLQNRTNKEIISLKTILEYLSSTHDKLSADFDKNRSIINLMKIITNLKKYYAINSRKKFYVDKNLKIDLIKLAIFLFVTGQSDFNKSNIEFVLETVGNQIKLSLAPYIDNSVAFFQRVNFIPPYRKIKIDPEFYIYTKRPVLSFTYEPVLENQTKVFVSDLAKVITKYVDIEVFYNQIKQINLKELLLSEKEKYNHTSLTKQNIKLAGIHFNTSINLIEKQIELLKENEKILEENQKNLQNVKTNDYVIKEKIIDGLEM